MAPGGTPVPPEARGRELPSFFFFFFLDLLPRWEKGFPSGPWPPWHGRGESPSEIGSVSLSLSVSAFCSAALSPFLLYPEIRNYDWVETFAQIKWRPSGLRKTTMGTKGKQHNHKQIKSIIAIHQPPIGHRKSTQTS